MKELTLLLDLFEPRLIFVKELTLLLDLFEPRSNNNSMLVDVVLSSIPAECFVSIQHNKTSSMWACF